jgi:valyl-tRNA synthetase
MDSRFNHALVEDKLYKQWEESGNFLAPTAQAAKKNGQTPFSMIMPPPNANDPLHVGHAMFITVQDIYARFNRSLGKAVLWLPGTDHAGIETQYVFEKKLQKQGQSRFNFDRETLFEMIWKYVQANSGIAIDQMKKLGASADWSRLKFTLDPDCVELTLQTFERMHEQKQVYRDVGLVNYCPKCGTGYSELEIKRIEQASPLYYLKYGPFTIATARPETKFRDTALAVNPSDPRFKQEIGKTYTIQGLLGPIKLTVVADESVDPEFGTGIMKVTPAHDPHDFDLGKRYNLPVTPIIDFQGKMDFSWFIDAATSDTPTQYLERAHAYHGKKVLEARKLMIEDLKHDDLLEKIDTHHHNAIATCYRCGTILEPLPLAQFFIKVGDLTQQALAVLDRGETVIHGAGHDKILRHWLLNLRDWNISRQIVWGIRMPVWYSTKLNPDLRVGFLDDNGSFVSGTIAQLLQTHKLESIRNNLQTLTAPNNATYVVSRQAPGDDYLQETDTFDTWFSSSQWPVNTLKTSKEGDFDFYYPTSLMETGYDILPFWVMRMMLMGLSNTQKTPFYTVYLHGLVRDEKGQKMSKSKGNVVNPLDLTQKYGADALRLALIISTTAGNDSSVGENKVRGMRNFSNKIWNAGRYLIFARENQPQPTKPSTESDFVQHLNTVIQETTTHLEAMRPGQAAEVVHNAFWHWYCDAAIEQAKRGELPLKTLEQGMQTLLVLLHPFVPFVTEAVWQELGYAGLLVQQPWPSVN